MSRTGSLPRKWSMRRICSSSRCRAQLLLKLAGGLEVVAEWLLDDHPASLGEAGLAEPRTTGSNSEGGTSR